MTKDIIDAACVRKLLDYYPEDGKLFWRYRPERMFKKSRVFLQFNTCFAGKEAFTSIDGRGYKSGRIWNKTYHAHRVAWAVQHNEWPDVIDHINGDRSDNRLSNLRNITKSENARRKAMSDKLPGVSFCKIRKLWRARVTFNYAESHIGYYKTEAEAIKARQAQNIKLGFTYYERKNND